LSSDAWPAAAVVRAPGAMASMTAVYPRPGIRTRR
jgi:hypothetical protein